MPRIPVYNSRVPAPGPVPGLGSDLAAPGRALARLGGAITGFGENLARKAAREVAADQARRAQEDADPSEQQDGPDGDQTVSDPDEQEELTRRAQGDVLAVLDQADDDARFSVMRADALLQASLDSDPVQLVARALAYFDAASRSLIEETGDPALRARRQVLAQDHRAVLEKRGAQRGDTLMVSVLNERLATALAGYANAVRRDPAMLLAMLKKGADAVTASAGLAGLGRERTEAMTQGWTKQAHVALVEGTIARDPALALASLRSGELDARLGNDAALTGRLTRQAERAETVAEAAAMQRARAQRQLFELRRQEHLEAIRKTGRGDAKIAALAATLLDPEAQAALHEEIEDAEAHNAARNTYAFMTAQEIDAEIRRPASQDGTGRKGGKAIRKTARDEILAERRKDPAGWAMQDTTVAEAFAAADQALESARPGTPEMEREERAYRRALRLRQRVQKDMGAEPRLLSEAERDGLAEELQSLASAGRLARIAELKRRYGDDYEALVKELSGRVAPDTGVLLAHAGDPVLAGALSRGMAMDSVAFKGARELSLPLTGGRLDKSRLEDKQLYMFTAGDRVVRTVYDRKADALVSVLADSGGGESGASGRPGRIRSAIHGAAQGAADVAASIPKSQAFFAAEIARATLEDMLTIQMGGEPFWVHRDHADKATIYRFQNASPEERLRMLAGQASQFPQDHPFYKFGEAISEFARENLPANPEFVDELSQKLARAGGGFGAFVIVGGVLRRAGVPPVISVSATGATAQMVAQFEDALGSGATMEEAYAAANLGALAGLTEGIPIARLFDRLDKATGGSIRRALLEAAKGGSEEALQEAFQTVTESLIASDLVGYDPERRMFEGVGENAGIGFTLGGLANFVAAIVGGRRDSGVPRDATANQRDGREAELARGDTSNAPSGDTVTERVESGVETVAQLDPDVSVAGTAMDESRRSRYAESSLHGKFRKAEALSAESGQEGHDVLGLADPVSGKRIVQPINDIERLRTMAEKNLEPLAQQLEELVSDLPGVEFRGARVKNPDRLAQKLTGGRRPDTLTDYLGGRIVVDNPLMFDEVVRVLTHQYKNMEVDDFIDNPREIGYRAIHVQVVLDNGMTAEIQLIPSDILSVYEIDHKNYEKWRDRSNLRPDELRQMEADEAWAREAYAEAYERWLQRADTESTWPKSR
jgi:hypothetical protein